MEVQKAQLGGKSAEQKVPAGTGRWRTPGERFLGRPWQCDKTGRMLEILGKNRGHVKA